VDETRAILDRLDRIERLRRAEAPVALQLEELRLLLGEAEVWSRSEGGDAGSGAVERLRAALEREARMG
jgi:hypothetical protein